MHKFSFEGIGTHWEIRYFIPNVVSDVSSWEARWQQKILTRVNDFDRTYSRFKKDSLVSKIAESTRSQHKISREFKHILSYGEKLSKQTNGQFNPAVGQILENLGYDPEYSFTKKNRNSAINLEWHVRGDTLYTNQQVLLDIGGWGKGYLIDLVAASLKKENITHFLVNGGGDVYASEKPDGSPWIVALEHPTSAQKVIEKIQLKNMAIASSGVQRRSFGDHHHLVNAITQESVRKTLALYVQAKTGMEADGAATALFVDEKADKTALAKKLHVEYLAIRSDLSYKKSRGFIGDIFSTS